jgi:membrane protein DedA with SNARE-associated domain
VLFFEELGVPSPLPGDVLMIVAGVGVRQGRYSLATVLLVQQLATLAGTTGLYYLSRRFGRALVTRYGRFLHLGPERLARAEAAIQRSGWRAIFVGRLIPGLRIVTPLAAGVLGVPFRVFLPSLAVSAFLYLLAYTLLGMLIGPAAVTFLERVSLPTGALVSLGGLAVVVYLARRLNQDLPATRPGVRRLATSPLLDGLLAGLAALLATNGIVGLLIFAARLLGNRVPVFATEAGTALRLLLGWPVFLLVTSLLAVLYDRLGIEYLPRPARIAIVAGIPLAVTLALAYPLMTHLAIDRSRQRIEVLAAIEALRWLAFGVALAEFLPLDTRLHQPGARTGRPAPASRSARPRGAEGVGEVGGAGE